MAAVQLAILFVCLLCQGFSVLAETPIYLSAEHKLVEALMTTYPTGLRPVQSHKDKVTVSLGIGLLNMDGLDEGSQTLYLTSWLR